MIRRKCNCKKSRQYYRKKTDDFRCPFCGIFDKNRMRIEDK